jgi:hypothetical protein
MLTIPDMSEQIEGVALDHRLLFCLCSVALLSSHHAPQLGCACMTSRIQLVTYVPKEVGDAFLQRTRSYNLTAASALRQLVIADVYGRGDPVETRRNILFQTIALDGLLQAHPDPELRPRLLRIWRERIAEEGLGYVA